MLEPPAQVLVVAAEQRGVQLVDLLAGELPQAHHAALRRLVGSGAVRVNGEVCLHSRRLRPGDVITVAAAALPQYRPPALERLPPILWQSPTALVVAKPPGITVVPDRSGRDAGLHGLLGELRPTGDLRVVHRLDRDTSGCLLLADGLAAAQHFDRAFRGGDVQKRYLGLVCGELPDELVIEAWLGPDPARPGKVISSPVERKGFRAARTEVRLLQRFGAYALLELQPRTGRGHQLRVHLQSIGHPLVGDRDYGGEQLLLSACKRGYKRRPGVAERPLLSRLFLHAASLSFTDLDGQQVAATAPLPSDLELVLQKLERFDLGRR